MSDAKQLLNMLYFVPSRNSAGQLVSKYEGTIVAFIVRKDDGSEYEVRDPPRADGTRIMQRKDLETLKIGDVVRSVDSNTKYTVLKVFPVYGDVWVKDYESGKSKAMKFNDLRKIL